MQRCVLLKCLDHVMIVIVEEMTADSVVIVVKEKYPRASSGIFNIIKRLIFLFRSLIFLMILLYLK